MSALSKPGTQSGPKGVLAALRSGAKPGEPMITTVERAVIAYRKGDRADKASARVAQIAGVIKAYLVRATDTTSIAWALALLETPGRTLAADEVDAQAMRTIQADQDFSGMDPQTLAVEILTASFRDWSAAEVERVVSDYAKTLTGGAWPELQPIEHGLRGQRQRFVDRVRQAVGRQRKSLAATSADHPGDRARLQAARDAARAELDRAAGRATRSTQDAISGLSDSKRMPGAFVPREGRTLRQATKGELDAAERRRAVLREQAADLMEAER